VIRAVLACDGREGHFPCKQATPTGVVESGAEARKIAKRDGWTHKLYAGKVLDLCPACTLRLELGKFQVTTEGLAA
jgi:hypothetical protein